MKRQKLPEEKAFIKFVSSVREELKYSYSLTQSNALFLMSNVTSDEVVLMARPSAWTAVVEVYEPNGQKQNPNDAEQFDFVGSYIVTNFRIYFLSEKGVAFREIAALDGFKLMGRDSIRAHEISISTSGRQLVRFRIRHKDMSEFQVHMGNMNKFELDPPTNPLFFASASMDPHGRSSMPLANIDAPRHLPKVSDTP